MKLSHFRMKGLFCYFFVKKDRLFILCPLVLAGICSGAKNLADTINKTRLHMITNKKYLCLKKDLQTWSGLYLNNKYKLAKKRGTPMRYACKESSGEIKY